MVLIVVGCNISTVHQTFLYILQPTTMRSNFLVPLSAVHQTFLYILQPTTMRTMILVPLSAIHQTFLYMDLIVVGCNI
jgi:hypothetical protein